MVQGMPDPASVVLQMVRDCPEQGIRFPGMERGYLKHLSQHAPFVGPEALSVVRTWQKASSSRNVAERVRRGYIRACAGAFELPGHQTDDVRKYEFGT